MSLRAIWADRNSFHDQDALVSTICQVFAADVGDLFAVLYDLLPEDPFLGYDASVWSDDWCFQSKVEHVRVMAERSGQIPDSMISEALAPLRSRELLAILMGLDRALQVIHPQLFDPRVTDLGALNPLADRYERTGKLNDERVGGAVLPRLTDPGRPASQRGKAEWFTFIRLSPSLLAPQELGRIDLGRVPSRYNIFPSKPGGSLRIGIAPLLDSLDDIMLFRTKRPDGSGYRIRPVDNVNTRKRVERILRQLDRSGAVIGVLPEACLCGSLLNYWKDLLHKTSQGAYKKGSELRLVLAGSGPYGSSDPPYNRAVVLDRRSGEEVFTQDKVNPFTLTDETIERWHLSGKLGRGNAYEDITRGDAILVRECSLGRIAIIICEDVTRAETVGAHLQACGVTHLFVPIFARPMQKYRFPHQNAEPLVWQVGATVVAINSLVVARAQGLKGAPNTAFVVEPAEDDENEWRYQYRPIRIGCPDKVVVIDLGV